jgi:hypothetical protein
MAVPQRLNRRFGRRHRQPRHQGQRHRDVARSSAGLHLRRPATQRIVVTDQLNCFVYIYDSEPT